MVKREIAVPYKRILLKLSGEILLGSQPYGIDPEACRLVAKSIANLKHAGLEIGLVIGGGNIFRGAQLYSRDLPRTPADQMGMLATLMNGIALQQALEVEKCPTIIMSALECPRIAESYNWSNAMEYLASQRLIIFAGGTGNPYFTTDTAAALRASEIQADILLKATKVDGVYDKDPLKYPQAKKYDTLSYSDYLSQKLEIMDAPSIALCMNNKIPIFVFNMQLLENEKILDTLKTHHQGTLIKGE